MKAGLCRQKSHRVRPLTVAGAALVRLGLVWPKPPSFPLNCAARQAARAPTTCNCTDCCRLVRLEVENAGPVRSQFGRRRTYNGSFMENTPSIAHIATQVEELLQRYTQLQRDHAVLQTQVAALTAERDLLRSKHAAARARIDALLDRLQPSLQLEQEQGGGHEAN